MRVDVNRSSKARVVLPMGHGSRVKRKYSSLNRCFRPHAPGKKGTAPEQKQSSYKLYEDKDIVEARTTSCAAQRKISVFVVLRHALVCKCVRACVFCHICSEAFRCVEVLASTTNTIQQCTRRGLDRNKRGAPSLLRATRAHIRRSAAHHKEK